jgi:hypothetical protein
MSEKEEPQPSATSKLDPIASEDQKAPQFNSDKALEKLESSIDTLVLRDEPGGFVPHPPAIERRLLRRIDWRLVPAISLVYWLLNLSQSQIGKAKIFGLTTDLHLTGDDFNIAVVMFAVPHILFAIPSNLALRFVKPRIWLPCISY